MVAQQDFTIGLTYPEAKGLFDIGTALHDYGISCRGSESFFGHALGCYVSFLGIAATYESCYRRFSVAVWNRLGVLIKLRDFTDGEPTPEAIVATIAAITPVPDRLAEVMRTDLNRLRKAHIGSLPEDDDDGE